MDLSFQYYSFPEQRDFLPPSYCSLPTAMTSSFDSSFSSSTSSSSLSALSTPLEYPADPFEAEGLMSSSSSFRSITPPKASCNMAPNMFDLPSQNIMLSTPTKHNVYMTPVKMLDWDTSFMGSAYTTSDSVDFCGTPPSLNFELNSSPLLPSPFVEFQTPSSARTEFVVPSQTCFESYEPSTPLRQMDSMLDTSDLSESQPMYFVTPEQPRSSGHSLQHSTGRSILVSTPTPSRRPIHDMTLKSSQILQQVQKGRISKGETKAAKHYCDFPGCKVPGFLRNEHLKRHRLTHTAPRNLKCPWCKRRFQSDRADNYRVHVKLHARVKKGSRTQYFPEAAELVEKWALSREETRLTSSADDDDEQLIKGEYDCDDFANIKKSKL